MVFAGFNVFKPLSAQVFQTFMLLQVDDLRTSADHLLHQALGLRAGPDVSAPNDLEHPLRDHLGLKGG